MQEDLDARDDSGVWPELAALQESCRRIAAEQARQVALTSRLVRRVTAQARLELASRPRVPGQPDDDQVIDSAVTGEVMAGLGVSRHDAGRLVDLADRLVRVLPATLVALADGTIDLGRAEALSSATAVLSDADARVVEAALLPQAGTRPWDGASPRAWRDRLQRVVVRTDRFAAQRRRREAIADRCVRAWPNGSGTSDLLIRGADCDVVMAEHVLTDLALASPEVGPDGGHRTLDQRRADAFFETLRLVRDGQPLPTLSTRREREIGLVLHVDTLVGEGPAAHDPGELRGLSSPVSVDAESAAELARDEIGAGAATCVLLTDGQGAVQRLVRLATAPTEGWTRAALVAAVRQALPRLPAVQADGYAPTVHITEHVRARNPRCTAYDCARVARRCDLDHDEPWPRGPTAVHNLDPRCRRDHELKTRGLLRTRLAPDGSVTTTMLTGLAVTTRPEPLPGFGPGEGYARATA